jgi:SAM-dependent methyltransferase
LSDTAYRHRDDCRLCGGTDLGKVLSLTPTPPANAFVDDVGRRREQPVFPLDLWFCRSCTHVQMLDVVDPETLFGDYVYVSGTSPVFVRHFEDYAATVIGAYGLSPGDRVVDIGSNDGTLLRAFQDQGMTVLGIDPARDIARRANEAGIETLAAFFDPALGAEICDTRGAAACVTANNVFAHVDDLGGVVDGVRALLAADGVFVFEVSYLVDVYEKTLFDTVYHEHLDYHSVRPLVDFFAGHGMQLIDAGRVASHGGSLRAVAQVAGGPHPVAPGVAELIAVEADLRLQREETLVDYGNRIDAVGGELRDLLDAIRADGKRVAGFGAPAKATTLMYHFGLGPETVEFIVDDSPLKQGLFTPGLHVPVLSSAAITERRPDYLLILAWNFAEAIIAKNQAFRDGGGQFIVPLPSVSVY